MTENKTSMARALRASQIGELQRIILIKMKNKDELNKKDMILSGMSKFHISKRTASEYVEVAFFNEGFNLK